MKVATVKGFSFNVPKRSWWSFYNSPYPAHRLGTAVDVYFPDEALFPFEEGRVVATRRVRTPGYVPVREDYLTIVKVDGFCLKVLHVKPKVVEGEHLTLGDPLGEMVVSGFFSPWSDRHAHFELRPCHDAYRARGAFLMSPILLELVPSLRGDELEVVECTENYCWARPLKTGGRSLTPLTSEGFPIEGGLPHYRYGALFGEKEGVELFGLGLSVGERLSNGVSIFDANFRVLANGKEIRGVGVYCNNPLFKLVGRFEEGEAVKLTFVRP
ncbi:hypothetical protein GQS_00435 [Thermococcus sp. 4557]|uniref:hypothetical protein n=1 Tax=Thermococcus sp. (strain CGMCC 1.5172 / 4557) TaxID=1042877 RepID=UPI000219E832|nr:hypothetical protein [Thermococcus sp. 4557]AEK71990.1 hypothetical protein GQS_00435 [Thermococcus sp. 4557]